MICLTFFFLLGGNVWLQNTRPFIFSDSEREGERHIGGERSRERKSMQRGIWRNGENDREWVEKERKKQRQEKGGEWKPSCSSSPPQTSPPSVSLQRENTTFCQIVSHHLFDLLWSYFIFIKNKGKKISAKRKCFKFYTTCPTYAAQLDMPTY